MAPPTPLHVVALPYPAQGHINPLLLFCHHLASFPSITITFVNTQHNHQRIFQQQQQQHQQHPNIRFLSIPGGLPPELHSDPSRCWEPFLATEELQQPFQQLLEKLMLDTPSVSFILSDALLSWTQICASKLRIPSVAFWTCSATIFSTLYHLPACISQGLVSYKATNDSSSVDEDAMFSSFPGLPPVRFLDVPCFPLTESTLIVLQFIVRQLQRLKNASSLLINTFEEIEKPVFDAFASIGPIYPVGPVLSPAFLKDGKARNGGRALSLVSEDDECLKWLDAHEFQSVLYISFGSISVMSTTQFEELARGLEASQQPFLWVVRPNSVNDVEEGIETLVGRISKANGLIVSWCPQFEVLSHASVGGFLTHCGWNSVLEGIYLGVPMLCWPDSGERRSNGRFIVDVWEVGREFKKRKEDGVVERGEVERVVRGLMKNGGEERERAKKLSEVAKKAMSPNGSSFTYMTSFVDEMRRRVCDEKHNSSQDYVHVNNDRPLSASSHSQS